ncbi:MAG: fructosamine kinase family protein [Phycisphaeraceae bacterium]|nr:fructosamine kinase family protein [Phycisphaeraceae bacterium]
MNAAELSSRIGEAPRSLVLVADGVGGRVCRATMNHGRSLIVKCRTNPSHPSLRIEAGMLTLLASRSRLPVPRVMHADDDSIVMQDMDAASAEPGPGVEVHAARLLASLHGNTSPDAMYGFDIDGAIGPLPQPNTKDDSWPRFYRVHRLHHMAGLAHRAGGLSAGCAARVMRLSEALDVLLPQSPEASLIHGDVWSGNVIARSGGVVAFIDPACYYAHAEVELAFISLFNTFGEGFFAEYQRHRAIEPGFWECRRAAYTVYPLLVHVHLFGRGYEARLDSTLETLGF